MQSLFVHERINSHGYQYGLYLPFYVGVVEAVLESIDIPSSKRSISNTPSALNRSGSSEVYAPLRKFKRSGAMTLHRL
jgi:hypothetical protein